MKKAFSLIEVLLAVALFSLVASSFIFLMIEAYKINERARDFTLATILAEEGMEAVRSIRDANFLELVVQTRSQCLAIKNNRWVLIIKRDSRNRVIDCIESIGKFSRQVYITRTNPNINTDRRKIISLVTWQPITGPKREVRLFSRITNWR